MKFERTQPAEEPDEQDSAHKIAEALRQELPKEGQTEKPVTNQGMEALRLLNKYGTGFRRSNDKIVCHLQRNGEDEVLFEVEAGPEGLKSADKQLQQLVEQQQQSVVNKYHVRFSSDGEEIAQQLEPQADGSTKPGGTLHARAPRLNELSGIEAALQKSQPAHQDADGADGIKFYFLPDSTVRGVDDQKFANYVASDKAGRSAIYIHPKLALGTLISERDVARFGIADAESSQEYLLTAELAKNTMARLKLNDQSIEATGLAATLGWVKPVTSADWLLRQKDGRLFTYDSQTETWLNTDKDGRYLDNNGQLATGKQSALKADASAVQDSAQMRPATAFITGPQEELVDGLALFRVSQKERANLLAKSPDLYQVIKKIDQDDLNLAYGTSVTAPRFLRAPDGSILVNNQQNVERIAAFESNK